MMSKRFSLPITARKAAALSALAVSFLVTIDFPVVHALPKAMGAMASEFQSVDEPVPVWMRDLPCFFFDQNPFVTRLPPRRGCWSRTERAALSGLKSMQTQKNSALLMRISAALVRQEYNEAGKTAASRKQGSTATGVPGQETSATILPRLTPNLEACYY
ncbi:hypothetical protein [Mesorhizobium sp. CA14]|uniref:hypothetical protein n=1 Tax=Mesorhizobium sp. CA14 TaxID=2876642 RepID=UPI001CCC910E|nr:hypothetical protein [Mesorhizobium sp. CA14]